MQRERRIVFGRRLADAASSRSVTESRTGACRCARLTGQHLIAVGPTLGCLAVVAAVVQPVRVYDLTTPLSASEIIMMISKRDDWLVHIVEWCALIWMYASLCIGAHCIYVIKCVCCTPGFVLNDAAPQTH